MWNIQFHTLYPSSEMFSRSSNYSEAQLEQYVKRRYCTSNRSSSSWLERGSFPVSCGINFMTSGFLYTSQSTFLFRPVAGKIALSSKSTGERSHLVHFCYSHYAIKYLMHDMMDYHCLKVFRSHDRRIGKHSPGFSVFWTRVHGCSDAEPCRVFQSRAPSWRSFLLTVNWSHARQVTYEVWGFHV